MQWINSVNYYFFVLKLKYTVIIQFMEESLNQKKKFKGLWKYVRYNE